MSRGSFGAAPIEAVTFDATGTLIHCPRLGNIYAEVLQRHGHDVGPARALALVHTVWREMSLAVDRDRDRFASHPDGARGWWRRFLERFCEHLGGPQPSRFAAAELYDRFARGPAWEVFPDVEPTLERLRRNGFELAVIANWDGRLPGLLNELGLGSWFETIVTSEAAGVEKPHPMIFQTALGVLGCPPDKAFHVGDRQLEDVEGALAVGMRTLRLRRSVTDGKRGLQELWDHPDLQVSC